MIVVIHRNNRREPWNALRLCRKEFAAEDRAEEYACARARSGALMMRRQNGQWEARYACRLCVRGKHIGDVNHRRWKPIEEFRCVEGDPWGEHTVCIPLDILLVVIGPLPIATFTGEGGFAFN